MVDLKAMTGLKLPFPDGRFKGSDRVKTAISDGRFKGYDRVKTAIP